MTALVPIQNLRSGTSNKRPTATGLAVGQIAVNYNEDDPAIYLRGHADALIKVSPTFVGSTAPNATPASGGTSGNSKGEMWLDTSTTPNALKIWNGSTWVESYVLASGTTLVSPTLTGTTVAPTVAVGTDDTQIATTAFVNAEIANDAPTKTGGGASGTWDISISGNAATATALQTARTISLGGDLSGSASFDGTGNVTITGSINADSVALGTDTTGNYVAAGATSGNGISGSVSSEGGTFTVSSNATNANTPSTIVYRDASGNFSAGTITATLNGNASSATALATARTITLAGDLSGSTTFDGTGNVTITGVVADDSHDHIIGNVDGLQTALDAKAPLASPALTGTPTAPTAANGTNTTQIATTAFVQTTVAANAALIGGSVTTTGSNKTLSTNEFCTVTADSLTITLPASPAAGASVGVSIGGSFTNTTIARNGQNIMGLAENLTIDKANVSVLFKYVDATRGWRLI